MSNLLEREDPIVTCRLKSKSVFVNIDSLGRTGVGGTGGLAGRYLPSDPFIGGELTPPECQDH